jgi:hypothetical protein
MLFHWPPESAWKLSINSPNAEVNFGEKHPMTLPTDYSTWIALAPAHELDTIKAQILAHIGDLGSVTSKNLLVELAARRRVLAADRRRAIEDPDFGLADGEEAAYGG